MARILNYISEIVENLNKEVDYNTLLKNEDMYVIAKYVSRNPRFLYGNCSPFVDTNTRFPTEGLVKADFGINTQYWKDLKIESNLKGKQKSEYFKERILTEEGKKDPDVRKLIDKLYTNAQYEFLVDALANLINYSVLNTTFQTLGERPSTYDKIYTNLNFESLPYGIINSINTGTYKHYIDYTGETLGITELNELANALSPVNLNLTNSKVANTGKYFQMVVNNDNDSIKLDYKLTRARGYIKNAKTYINKFLKINEEIDYNCSPLSLESIIDQSYFTNFFSKDTINKEATEISLKQISDKASCTEKDLEKIQKQSDLVESLPVNEKYTKVTGIRGKEILQNVMPFSCISRNFYDASNNIFKKERGQYAISSKLYFDKQNESFINVRSNDLFFALSCATYGDNKEDVIDIYFNENKNEAYFVNKNAEQYGYCKGISSDFLSNSEHIIYAELFKPSLSIQQKTLLFEEQDVRPVLLAENVIEEAEGLQESIQRQSKLIDIQDGELFYKLLLKSITSYIYTYAEQVQIKDKSGKFNLVWQNKKNPKWSLDASEGKYYKNKDGNFQWSNPDYFYIYDVRETFWKNNQNMTIKEVLAYFVTKGGSSRDNSSYFRKLCQRILGIDYFVFSKKLFPILLQEGHICIEEFDIAIGSGQVTNRKYSYSYEYASGDVYKKLNKLQGELSDNIRKFYGENKGNIIIDNQFAILEKSIPEPLSFGDKDPNKNLIVNVHNPIFFASDDGFVGRIGKGYGVFRDGKVKISTVEQGDNMYNPIKIGGSSRQMAYDEFKRNNPLNLTNNHLKKFYEWIMFGKGIDFISNPFLKQNEFLLIEGYVFPIPSAQFITKHILPKFEKIIEDGSNIKAPLEFIPELVKSQKTFTRSNLYKKSDRYQYSNLTQQSRENLIKVGLVEDKPKVEVELKIADPKDRENTITVKKMFTPITEEEAKRIYNVITDKYKKLESDIIVEGNTLFTAFCKTQLKPDYRIYLEKLWNSTYNNMAIADYTKFPIFVEHSRWFGKMPRPFLFNLREAQVEGMKFAVANKNAGLLAHEVGFGKTTTSIAMMSHMILTGESKRTIVFTPNQVYEKFADEIIGRDTTGVLGLLSNWQVIEKNKRENNKDAVDVVMFGNGSQKILFGTKDKQGLKEYNEDELLIIDTWNGRKGEGVLAEVKKQISNLPAGRATFLPEDTLPIIKFTNGKVEGGRFSETSIKSSAEEWYEEFLFDYLPTKIPQLFDDGPIQEASEEIINKIKRLIDYNVAQVDSEFERIKTGYRYTIQDFTGDKRLKIAEYPQSIQEWWKKADPKANKNIPNYAIAQSSYPQKGWIDNPSDALKDGVITQAQYDKIVSETKALNTEWEGALTEIGVSKIKSLENKVGLEFFNPIGSKNTGKVTALLKKIEGMLIDVLGIYRPEVLKPNKIVLCSHQAIKQFRATSKAREKAKMYVQNVEDVRYVNKSTNRFFDNLANQPLSLRKLNIDGICVDEIHNFNNLISKPREHMLSNVAPLRGGQKKIDKDFHILPTMSASAALKFLPDGENINSTQGLQIEDNTNYHHPFKRNIKTEKYEAQAAYRLKYYSSGKGSLTTAPSNLMALVFQIQSKEENQNVNNTILMSATPFTDNIFQMFSVFGMTNLEKMKDSNIMSVWDFFVTFVKEEWRYNITHRQTFGLFPEIKSYYNSAAMANFIKSMANFKVSDKIIEATRPLKYIIPQDGADGGFQAGANTSSVQWAPELQNVSSYIELSDVQKQILKKIAEYVEGKIDIPFEYCPNYGEAIKVEEETGLITYANEEVEESIEEVNAILKQAKQEEQESNEWIELFHKARKILVELREKYPEDGRIASKQSKVDKALFEPETLKDMADEESLYDSNYQDIDLTVNSKNEVRLARAIVGQGFGQLCVISPYLLKCDKSGNTPNDLLKDFPLYPDDKSKSAKNFVENSPKIKYAIECAINTITNDSKSIANDKQVGGQIIYVNKGKSMKYGGNYYNLYEMIETYIVDRNVKYYDNIEEKEKVITKDQIGIITGGMSKTVDATDKFNNVMLDENGDKKKIGTREDIRDKFNDGRIKILIGSSAIKEGIDLNKRAHTLYVLDSDFSPSNAMQLEGRIWRQGNMWEFVRIVYVLGRDSIDAFIYSKLQTKINEIKVMLEQGVYELNKTQYTINAKERIRNIISDIDQLTDLAWQDKVDELNAKVSRYSDIKGKLNTIKNNYGKVKDSYDKYVFTMNQLYKLVIDREIRMLADKEKTRLDIQKQYEYQVDSRGRGSAWKEENKFVPVSMSDAIDIIQKEIDNNNIILENQDIYLNSSSQMTEVNEVADKVRRMIRARKGEIQTILDLEPDEQNLELSRTTEESSLGKQIVKVIFGNQKGKKGFTYDALVRRVNEFVTGSENESIMSNYYYLIENQVKDEKTKENYSIYDIDELISSATNKIIEGQKELDSEKKWKEKRRVVEKEIQEANSKNRGDNLETLIENFNRSMPLLKIRVK